MTKLSYISTSSKTGNTNTQISLDESIGAMVFDISGFSDPFSGYAKLYSNFKGGAVQSVNNMDEASMLGIEDNGFLNGMVYYHLSQFYKFIGGNQTVYIAFADFSDDWGALMDIKQQAGGRLFHIGIWTSQPLWKLKDDGTLGFTSLITDIQLQADRINGKIGESTPSATPLSFILFANSFYIGGDPVSCKKLPDAISLDCPKVSVVLAQNGSAEVHSMQANNPNNAPISSIGLVLACLALSGAEESIAAVKRFDLNKNEQFNNPELCIYTDNTPYKNVSKYWINLLSVMGYITPISYDGLEASYFLSSDQTLSDGDYCSISNNRVIHKCRRAINIALRPYINADIEYSATTGRISDIEADTIVNKIYTIIDTALKNKLGYPQISDRHISIMDNAKMFENDELLIEYSVVPANYSSAITEEVSIG